jgi:hypothetical protein
MKQIIAPMLALAVISCATTQRPRVNLYTGPDQLLDDFVLASHRCGYAAIEKTLGSHLAPMVVLTLPAKPSPELTCALDWWKAHQHDHR